LSAAQRPSAKGRVTSTSWARSNQLPRVDYFGSVLADAPAKIVLVLSQPDKHDVAPAIQTSYVKKVYRKNLRLKGPVSTLECRPIHLHPGPPFEFSKKPEH